MVEERTEKTQKKNWIPLKLAKEFKETFLLKQYFRVHGMRQKKKILEEEVERSASSQHPQRHWCSYLRMVVWERCLLYVVRLVELSTHTHTQLAHI